MDIPRMHLLYAYDRWANQRVVAAAEQLPAPLLRGKTGTPSVWTTLQHILWGKWLWLGRWQERPPTGMSPLSCADLADLKTRWHEIEREVEAFLDRLSAADLERRLRYDNPPGTPWTYRLADMLQHVVNHSSYHRGQVALLLRQLGQAAPPTDFLLAFDEGVVRLPPEVARR